MSNKNINGFFELDKPKYEYTTSLFVLQYLILTKVYYVNPVE